MPLYFGDYASEAEAMAASHELYRRHLLGAGLTEKQIDDDIAAGRRRTIYLWAWVPLATKGRFTLQLPDDGDTRKVPDRFTCRGFTLAERTMVKRRDQVLLASDAPPTTERG